MSHPIRTHPASTARLAATLSGAIDAAAEVAVRQLLADGHDKAALKRAKDMHQAQRTAASEALLVDAYLVRIQSLLRQELALEADRLADLVRERHPSAKPRLDELNISRLLQAGAVDDAIAPLRDPALSAERRTMIERAIEHELRDLARLAGSTVLGPDDPLRKAASAIESALTAVTTGPVSDEALALPEVSHRSPLAPWKQLVRAIAAFYRGDDSSCGRYLGAIAPGSAPARVVPAIREGLGQPPAAPLTPASRRLAGRIAGEPVGLRDALDALDRAFAGDIPDRTYKAIRCAVDACQEESPGLVDRLRQHISVRSAMAALNVDRVTSAMRRGCRPDAYFLRLFARALEERGDPESLPLACGHWAQFRTAAATEGWFAPNGIEAATLYLHMAALLGRIPDDLLQDLHASARREHARPAEELYFLFPETLYQRACALDPRTEAFSQWLTWAARPGGFAMPVAEAWHRILPRDLDPILHLMQAAERCGQFDAALGYLAKAERIDGVHPVVRGARLRLLARRAMRHIQKRKLALAERDLIEMNSLPQAQQGDRPALLAALGALVAHDRAAAEACRAQVERLLGSRAAGAIWISGVAAACKQAALWPLDSIDRLSTSERTGLPAAVARVAALAADLDLDLTMPQAWIAETAKRFAENERALDAGRLLALGRMALRAEHVELAYAISAAGLARAGGTEARFLLLRVRALPVQQAKRRDVCAAAAVDLARRCADAELVTEALDLARTISPFGNLSLTPAQADDVVRTETAQPAAPGARSRGPQYRDIVDESCQCADCRLARGEAVEDDELDAILDASELPPDMPPEIARALLEETRDAVGRGESLEGFLARIGLGGRPRKKRRKGRRK